MTREDKRARILISAKSVFSSKGYGETVVQDILNESGVARATFYKYFSSKRHVFSEIMRNFLETLYENTLEYMSLETGEPGAFAERMEKSLEMFYRLFLENRGVVVAYFGEAFSVDPGLYAVWDNFERRMIVLFSGILRRGIDAGMFRELDEDLVARAMLMIFVQVPYREVMARLKASIDVESMALELSQFVMKGVMLKEEQSRPE